MAHRICAWWVGYLLASPVRRWLGQDPVEILSPYIREGLTVFEPGPGMGFFTIPLARIIGSTGRVIAVDVQPKMIQALKRRAAKENLSDRIDARVTSAETMGIADLARESRFHASVREGARVSRRGTFLPRSIAGIETTRANAARGTPRTCE